jgi:hypothetical protein
MRDCRSKARNCRRSSKASHVYRPCFSAFLLPRVAPDPGAPPCIRQRLFPLTAGDLRARIGSLADREAPVMATNDLVVRRALVLAGVEFIDENGGGPGVRLRKRPRAKTAK